MALASDVGIDYFFDEIHPHPHLWIDQVKDVCALHGINALDIQPFSDGVNLVASVNDALVVKIFPPFHRHQWESDARALKHLQGCLSLPIPTYIAAGDLAESWRFLIMSKVEGVPLERVWRDMSHENKVQIMAHIGKDMAEVHAIDVGDLKHLEPQWNRFLGEQASACKVRHEKKGMPQWFVKGLDTWLKDSHELLNEPFQSVILTGEYTPFNLLVQPIDGHFRLSGMIDFGDTMIGSADYDLLGPSVFLGEGDPLLIRALFSAYGYDLSDAMTIDSLRRKLLTLQILHRYSDFKSQLRIADWENKVGSFDDLARLIWPL